MQTATLETDHLKDTSISLNKLLASFSIHYQDLRHFHWTIEGSNFFQLHSVFEEFYNEAKVNIDNIAERILTLHNKPLSKMSDYLYQSQIDEATNGMRSDQMVKKIIANHAILITQIKEAIVKASNYNDEGTIDLLSGILSSIEKKSWMLSAYLK